MVNVGLRIETTLHSLRGGNPLLTGRYREANLLKTPVLAHLDAKPLSADSR